MEKYSEVLKQQSLVKLGFELAEKTNNKINLNTLKECTNLFKKGKRLEVKIEKTTKPEKFNCHSCLNHVYEDWQTGSKSGNQGCIENAIDLYGVVKFGKNLKHETYKNGNLIEYEKYKSDSDFDINSINIILKEITEWDDVETTTTYLLVVYIPEIEDKKINEYKEYFVTMGDSGMIIINNVEYLKKFNLYEKCCELSPYYFINNSKELLIDTLKTIAKYKNINNPIVLDKTKEQEEKLTEYMKEKHYKNQK